MGKRSAVDISLPDDPGVTTFAWNPKLAQHCPSPSAAVRTVPLPTWLTVTVSSGELCRPTGLWDRKKWEQIDSDVPDLPPLHPDKKPPAGKVRKIRLYPSTEQKEILRRWFGTARWTYNRALDAVNSGTERTRKAVRATCVNNTLWTGEMSWVKETPYEVRDGAIIDLLNAYQTNFAAKRAKFTMRYRSRKASSECINLPSKCYRGGVFFPRFWNSQPLRSAEPLPPLDYDCRLQRTKLGHYYLCIPQPLEIKSDNQAPNLQCPVIALDPGVRTFLTGYFPDSAVVEFGKGDFQRIRRLCEHLDKLQSKWSQPSVRQRQRYRMKRAGARLRLRIQNLIRACHHKVAKMLLQMSTVIILPVFETSKMVTKKHRNIGSKTARALMTWSHYRFRQILLNKAREYPWARVIIVNEAYTSKTCSECGAMDTVLEKKGFRCRVCNFGGDRDMNAARNILHRFLVKNKRADVLRRFWDLAPGAPAQSTGALAGVDVDVQ